MLLTDIFHIFSPFHWDACLLSSGTLQLLLLRNIEDGVFFFFALEIDSNVVFLVTTKPLFA